MRIVAGWLLVAVGGVFCPQSSQDFRTRYGEPDRERFAARPGISLTVDYGSDQLACYALIEAPRPLTYSEDQARFMSSEGASEVLEEVAPMAMRGKEVMSAIHVSGCNEVHISDYENLSIVRSTHTCDPSSREQDIRTAITFKRSICPTTKSPITSGRP